VVTLERLREFDLIYLATPYSKYPTGIEQAFIDAAALAACLLTHGVRCYSPIAHTHPIAIYGNIDPRDHTIWMQVDKVMMRKCDALVIAQMESWEISKGIGYEINYFLEAEKPIFYVDPTSLAVEASPEPKGCAA
jgi:nucleoside 2-deoxyribosyltransferase